MCICALLVNQFTEAELAVEVAALAENCLARIEHFMPRVAAEPEPAEPAAAPVADAVGHDIREAFHGDRLHSPCIFLGFGETEQTDFSHKLDSTQVSECCCLHHYNYLMQRVTPTLCVCLL